MEIVIRTSWWSINIRTLILFAFVQGKRKEKGINNNNNYCQMCTRSATPLINLPFGVQVHWHLGWMVVCWIIILTGQRLNSICVWWSEIQNVTLLMDRNQLRQNWEKQTDIHIFYRLFYDNLKDDLQYGKEIGIGAIKDWNVPNDSYRIWVPCLGSIFLIKCISFVEDRICGTNCALLSN